MHKYLLFVNDIAIGGDLIMLSIPDSLPSILYALDGWVMDALRNIPCRPIRVLDIGPGWGKWGLMLKEIFASRLAENGDMTPCLNSRLQLHGVEMCEYFLSKPSLGAIYDKIYSQDVREKDLDDYAYDLVMAFDVLEHWHRDEIIITLRKFTSSDILVSIPYEVVMYEDPYYGDDCPKHTSQLTVMDYRSMFPGSEILEVQCVGSRLFWVET